MPADFRAVNFRAENVPLKFTEITNACAGFFICFSVFLNNKDTSLFEQLTESTMLRNDSVGISI